MNIHKQPPEVFCKKKCSKKFRKIHRKTPVSEKTPEACNFIKKETLTQVSYNEFCEISKSIFFTKHLGVTASEKILCEEWGNPNKVIYKKNLKKQRKKSKLFSTLKKIFITPRTS